MTKISYLRKQMQAQYENRNLEEAAAIGRTLIAEQRRNRSLGKAFSDDLFNLGLVYDELGRVEEALEAYDLSTNFLADSDLNSWAMRSNNVGGVLAREGAGQMAGRFLARAHKFFRAANGAEHPSYADALYNLANFHGSAKGGASQALRLHKEALVIREKAGTPEDVLHSLHSIAFLHEGEGETAKASTYAEAAVLHAKRHGTDADYVSACNYMARILESNNQYEKALEMYGHVLETISTTGCTRNTYADCLKNMAQVCLHMGNPASAEKSMLEALKAREAKSEEILGDICFLIKLYLQEDTYDKAVDMLVYALRSMDHVGETLSSTAIDLLMEALAVAEDKPRLMQAIKDARDAPDVFAKMGNT